MKKTPPPLEGRVTWPVKVSKPHAKEGNFVFRSEVERRLMTVKKLPGSGAYEVYNPSCKMTGYYIPVTPRFKGDGKDTPGPGYYEINPNYTESTAKTKISHNKIIQAEIKRIEPKLPKLKKPKAEPKRTLDKKLRWFETPVLDYIHC